MNHPKHNHTELSVFHPLIESWFERSIGEPTEIQAKSWHRIASGDHVLITAPTGSGKTLTAFLWAMNQLITGRWPMGRTNVLYISPLKALNNDIQRNLIQPLEELKDVFLNNEEEFPDIHVLTRSGDTPQTERRRMLRHPPEILITTPESLNLLLSSTGGKTILHSLKTVILDEIHAVVGNKRGTHLITAVDRLVPLSGEFQRISLSATVKPLETVADFIGGTRLTGTPQSPRYEKRRVEVISAESVKPYHIRVRFPEEANEPEFGKSFWDPLVEEFRHVINQNRSTLLFVNNRSLAEKLASKINAEERFPIAYAHHGSLSREIRYEVEKRLKCGDLKAIVATNSLELGIDIGALDQVLLIQSPPSISSAVQRIGRAGHRVGETSRGTLYPTFAHDFLESAVLARAIITQDIEAVYPILCPLDVLAQIIVSMAGTETRDIHSLYAHIVASYPYRDLTRRQFDLVLNMLAGKYAETHIRELRPLISIDRIEGTVTAKGGALLSLYMSGGMIPDRGYYQLRHETTNARIGELDEEFVWEARIGQTFSLGAQNWKITRITHNDVIVVPGNPKTIAPPFWKGEQRSRDFTFSMKLAEFLEQADARLDEPGFDEELQSTALLEPKAAGHLIQHLKKQKAETNTALPHRHHLVIEHVETGPGGAPGHQLILHTLWGGSVNRPFALALDGAWEERFGRRLEIFAANDSIVIQMPDEIETGDLLTMVTPDSVESLLKKRLESSGIFGARFRECAGRALLLPKKKISERMPLWMTRLRSQKLIKAVSRYSDFPIMLEAWRSCLQDDFNIDGLKQVLSEIKNGVITVSQCRTSQPSPFARTLEWRQINAYMYRGDEPENIGSSKLHPDLLSEVVFTPGLRPSIDQEIVEQFLNKRQRLHAGYSPSSANDLVDWVKERLLIPEGEWQNLRDAMERDCGEQALGIIEEAGSKLLRIQVHNADGTVIASREAWDRIQDFLYDQEEIVSAMPMNAGELAEIPTWEYGDEDSDPDSIFANLLGQWLQFYGPVSTRFIERTLGLNSSRLRLGLDDLLASRRLILGELLTGRPDDHICDSENFETLLRISRKAAMPAFQSLDIEMLPLFLAHHQGLTDRSDDIEGLYRRLEQLFCYTAQAEFWETEFLPARVHPYMKSWLDSILQESDYRWVGRGKKKITFCFESDLDLLADCQASHDSDEPDADEKANPENLHLPDPNARYTFSALLDASRHTPSLLAEHLWESVWRGSMSNDHFGALRKGIQADYKLPDIMSPDRRRSIRTRRAGSRARFAEWKGSLPYSGNWFRLPHIQIPEDKLEIEEIKKDRVRLLMDRYGILFRELLSREDDGFQWHQLFRSLRLMELSGEILSGYFFERLPGPQFISHRAFHLLSHGLPKQSVYWINAADPASCCGLSIEGLRQSHPRRVPSTHLVYRGGKIILISRKHGRILEIFAEPEDPAIPEYLCPLSHLLQREFRPLRRILVETINGEPAATSPYAEAIRSTFDTMSDHKHLTLYRQSI